MKYFMNNGTVFLICLLSIIANGQNVNTQNAAAISQSDGNLCEYNNNRIDALAMAFRANEENILFVISHGGTNESPSVLKRRLDHTKLVLLHMKKFNEKRTIFASGDKIKGKGKIDFYVGSQLFLTINMKKNGSVCFLTPDYCGPRNELCK